jgi:hypothetical protein
VCYPPCEASGLFSSCSSRTQVHGLRQEMRFSLSGRDLETAVKAILHVFRTARSPFDEFSAVLANNTLELEVEAMSFEEYGKLLRWRIRSGRQGCADGVLRPGE